MKGILAGNRMASLASLAAALPLLAWWAFFAVLEPSATRKAVLSSLSCRLGLEVKAASVLRTGGRSAEARGLSLRNRGAEIFSSESVSIESGPDFGPPYRICCAGCALDLDLASPLPFAAEGASFVPGGLSLEFSRGSLAFRNHPALPGLGLRIQEISGSLALGPDAEWRASGAFGAGAAGSFQASGKGAACGFLEIEFREWTVADRILASASPSIGGAAVSAPLRGEARGSIRVSGAGPATVMCSFRGLGSPLLEGVSGSGYASVAAERRPEGVSFGGNFFLDRLDWGCMRFSLVSGVVEGGPDRISLRSMSGKFMGGRARGGVSAFLGGEGSASLSFSLEDGDASETPNAFLGSEMPLKGRISLNLDADFDRISGPGSPGVRGTGSFEWTGAVLGYLPLVSGLDRFVSFPRQIVFKTVKALFSLGPEGILLRNGSASGPLFDLELARPGAVRFDRKTDLEILVKRGHQEERKFPVFTKLSETMKKMFIAPFKDVLTLGIRISGDYLDPDFELILPGKGR